MQKLIFYSFILVLIVILRNVSSLECYTGYTVVRGSTVGTTTEKCKSDSDYCYKAKADLNLLNKLKLAGCSTFRCMATKVIFFDELAPNKCYTQTIAGQMVELCCCNDKDFCNGAQPNSIKSVFNKFKNAVTGGGVEALSKVLGSGK
uniref:Activin_recp domain-containing protein n=1 Tax=Panagrolaimus sp. ES5 TaxID=591445 RepID=A0AC34F4E9_9BILA